MNYDVIIIGSGPAGYSAAMKGVRLGAKVCLIEKDELGGVCVNRGCIPTKAILSSARFFLKLKNAGEFGIKADNVSFDPDFVFVRAEKIISEIKNGMQSVLNAGKIAVIKGMAEIISEGRVKVNNQELNAKGIIVATGSKPKTIKGFNFDNDKVFSSESFLANKKIPKSVLIVGGGVIGCEWAGIFASFGVDTRIVEMEDRLLPAGDLDISRAVFNGLKKLGVNIQLKSKADVIDEETVIVCVGREPVLDGLKILQKNEAGFVRVNDRLETNIKGIYAAGDIKGPPFFAYTADRDGEIAMVNALGGNETVNYDILPQVSFTIPETASVGIRQTENESLGVARGYYKALGKAMADGETEGFLKIVYDKTTKKIKGAHIVGSHAGELINEAAVALKCGLTAGEWLSIMKPHPVLSELFSTALNKIV